MKPSPAAWTTAVAIAAASIVSYLTIGSVIRWACTRLLKTALDGEMGAVANAAVALLVAGFSAYVAVQFVYAAKSPYLTRAPVVPWLGSGLTVVIGFLALDRSPVPTWEMVALAVGVVAGIFLAHRAHLARGPGS